MAKKKAEEKINLDSILFKCRDILRAARNSGSFFEKRDMMLTLVFLRFIGEKFEDGVENLCDESRNIGANIMINDDLTRSIAFEWLYSRGARFVQDGLNERKKELQYREYARKMELDFPQTAKVLLIIADDYHWEAKHDQLDLELFQQ